MNYLPTIYDYKLQYLYDFQKYNTKPRHRKYR